MLRQNLKHKIQKHKIRKTQKANRTTKINFNYKEHIV
jgi:hypothetical protein